MQNRGWESLFFFSEAVMIVFYCVGTTFTDSTHSWAKSLLEIESAQTKANSDILQYYAMWQDIHVMIFIGFGFLMTFLKTHSWSSIGFNFLIGCWAIQCVILSYGFWNQAIFWKTMGKIPIEIKLLIQGDYGAAACLISMGALLGKTTFPQLMIIVTVESIVYSLNRVICIDLLAIHDPSGSMMINVFGAYFGIAASMFFNPSKAIEDKTR